MHTDCPSSPHPAPPPDSTRRAYYREFHKVVEMADVVLEVLDARDPLGCRCPQVRGEGAECAGDANARDT